MNAVNESSVELSTEGLLGSGPLPKVDFVIDRFHYCYVGPRNRTDGLPSDGCFAFEDRDWYMPLARESRHAAGDLMRATQAAHRTLILVFRPDRRLLGDTQKGAEHLAHAQDWVTRGPGGILVKTTSDRLRHWITDVRQARRGEMDVTFNDRLGISAVRLLPAATDIEGRFA